MDSATDGAKIPLTELISGGANAIAKAGENRFDPLEIRDGCNPSDRTGVYSVDVLLMSGGRRVAPPAALLTTIQPVGVTRAISLASSPTAQPVGVTRANIVIYYILG